MVVRWLHDELVDRQLSERMARRDGGSARHQFRGSVQLRRLVSRLGLSVRWLTVDGRSTERISRAIADHLRDEDQDADAGDDQYGRLPRSADASVRALPRDERQWR